MSVRVVDLQGLERLPGGNANLDHTADDLLAMAVCCVKTRVRGVSL